MKKLLKKNIRLFIGIFIGGVIFSGITYVIATTYYSNNVVYNNANSTLTATNVEDALDELYRKSVGPIITSVVDNEDLTATVSITITVNPVASVCVNSTAKRTDNCTWKSVSGTSFTTNAVASSGNYYIHVQDTGGRITHSSSVSLTQSVVSLIDYINSLYNGASKTSVTTAGGESITQASSVGLMQDSFGNIRYYGTSPNNYVTFNGELWRIIGIVDGKVKLIRSESIGNYQFDNASAQVPAIPNKSSIRTKAKLMNDTIDDNMQLLPLAGNACVSTNRDYSSSTLKLYLNDAYYTELSITAKNIIQSSIWNLGGISQQTGLYADDYYNYEKGTNVPSGYSTTWTGNIGLMSFSDYAYATDLSVCTKTGYQYSDDTANCTGKNWLFNSNNQWVISPINNSDTYSIVINIFGNISDFNGVDSFCSNNLLSTRPTIYLNTNVIVDTNNKDGSSTYPYGLSL